MFVDESMILYQATFFKTMDAQFMESCTDTVTTGLHLHGFIAIVLWTAVLLRRNEKRKEEIEERNREKGKGEGMKETTYNHGLTCEFFRCRGTVNLSESTATCKESIILCDALSETACTHLIQLTFLHLSSYSTIPLLNPSPSNITTELHVPVSELKYENSTLSLLPKQMSKLPPLSRGSGRNNGRPLSRALLWVTA